MNQNINFNFYGKSAENLKADSYVFYPTFPHFCRLDLASIPLRRYRLVLSSVCGYQSMYQHLLHLHLLWRLFLCLIIYSWLLQKQFHSIWKKNLQYISDLINLGGMGGLSREDPWVWMEQSLLMLSSIIQEKLNILVKMLKLTNIQTPNKQEQKEKKLGYLDIWFGTGESRVIFR